MKSRIAAAMASGLLLGTPVLAESSALELGTLTCTASEVKNKVLVSTETFDCTFERVSGVSENYTGEIRRIGVDLTFKSDIVIVWMVTTATAHSDAPDSIAGTYVGGGAEVAVGAGVGARVLVGGGDDAFSLNPISVSAVGGAGASLGVERFELKPAS